MGTIWGREDPGGPHVGPMNFAIWVTILKVFFIDHNIFISSLKTSALH